MTRSEITDDARNALLRLAGKQRIPSTNENDVSGDSRNPEGRDRRNPNKRKRGLIHNPSENEPENTVLCQKMDDAEFKRFKTIRRQYNYDWLRKSLPSLSNAETNGEGERNNESLGAESDDKYKSGNKETDAKSARNEITNGGSISSRVRLKTGDSNIATQVNCASSVGLSNDLDSQSSDDVRACKKCQNKKSPPPKKMRIQLSDALSKVDRRGKASQSQLPQANKDKPIIVGACKGTPMGVESEAEMVHRPEDESGDVTTKNKKKSPISASKSKNGPDRCGGHEDESGEGTTKNKEKTLPPPSKSKYKPDHSGDDNTPRNSDAIASDVGTEEGGTAKAEETKQGSKGQLDLGKMLVDCVLGRGKTPGAIDQVLNEEPNRPPVNRQSSTAAAGILLPLKFRFDDEVQKEPEKTDHEIEMEGLFSDLDHVWDLSELKALDYSEPQVGENATSKETQHDRCRRGLHELTLRDEEGLVCMCCNHVELGPKEVMPEWAPKTRRGSDKKRRYSPKDVPELEGVDLQPSANNAADFDCSSTGGTVWEIKAGVRETMYEHQREGFEFLWKNIAGSISLDELRSNDKPKNVGGCIISHAPGTGKTRLTIVFIETYLKVYPGSRPMIIAPTSMLMTWEEEFRKWNVEFPFFNLNSSDTSNVDRSIPSKLLKQRSSTENVRMVKLYSWDTRRSVLGISYCLFEKLASKRPTKETNAVEDERIESMRRILFEKPGLVVLDEGHLPRNHRTNIWNGLVKIKTEKRVILSGTPFQNNFGELFNTLRIVRPAVADSLAQQPAFSSMIASRKKKKGDRSFQQVELDDQAVDRLKLSISPFVHVHKGTILRQNLPGLRDCVVLLKPSDLQRSLIERLEGSTNTFEFEHRVAMISVHPYLYQQIDLTEEQRTGVDVQSVEASRLKPNEGAKTRFIMELVHLSSEMGEKVLVFSQYIDPLELIKEQLKHVFNWSEGRQILHLQGKLELKQRQLLINVFNDPTNDSKVMLASTKCCSEGISLVGASRVILLDVLWNPSVERQAICRAYRIGQKKVVYTYHLMTLGTTEADKYCRQAEKERLSELVFTSSSNESNKEKPSSSSAACIADSFLEQMVGRPRLKGMFEKIINQPKDANLIETFGLTS